jgi:polygalacturonase
MLSTINIGTPNNHDGDPLRTSFTKTNDGITKLNNATTGVFNILDYGAISDDGIADQAAIQAAVDAAAAYGSDPQGGKVVIPAGKWYITGAVTLRSYIQVEVDANAHFYFPSNYSGSMWYNPPGNILQFCSVNGGYYGDYTMTRTWKCIDLRASDFTTSYVMFCKFSNMYIENCNIGINKVVTLTGWENGNSYNNITIWDPIIGIQMTHPVATGGGMGDNKFINTEVQTLVGVTTYCVNMINCLYNNFTNLSCYDIAGSTIGVNLDSTSSKNSFMGSCGFVGSTFADGGMDNIYFSNYDGNIYLGYGSQIGFYNNQCSIVHGGNTLTLNASAGVIMSKLKITALSTYANNTAALSGGLTAGMVYRTSTGQLMIVY